PLADRDLRMHGPVQRHGLLVRGRAARRERRAHPDVLRRRGFGRRGRGLRRAGDPRQPRAVLNRLVSLARYLDVPGPPALGLAIYADDRGAAFAARETGEEGVACVDDVARALVLWCDLWERTHEPVAREWVDGLLAFCRWMQLDDGRFANFILDWSGALNIYGLT